MLLELQDFAASKIARLEVMCKPIPYHKTSVESVDDPSRFGHHEAG